MNHTHTRWFTGWLAAVLFVTSVAAQTFSFLIPPVEEVITVRGSYLTWVPDPWTDPYDPDYIVRGHFEWIHWAYQYKDTTGYSWLTVTTNGQDITGASWNHNPVAIPPWIQGMLSDPDFLMPEIDDQDGTVWSPDLAFEFLPALRQVAPPLIKAVTKRSGKWLPAGLLIYDAISREEAIALVEVYLLEVAEQLMKTRQNPREVWSNCQYAMLAFNGRLIYSGRARGWGTPDIVCRNRGYGHAVDRPDFLPPVPEAWVVTKYPTLAGQYAARGWEQSAIDFQRARLRSANTINGVSPTNPRGYSYHLTSLAAYPLRPEIHPFTGLSTVGAPLWPPSDLIHTFANTPMGLGL